MLHPVIETLLFLKIARKDICESIRNSEVETKEELANYITNEASDYEVMHLITMGEMPEEKFNSVNEQAVWNVFKRQIVENINVLLAEDISQEDINTMIFEMGPVSEQGYSSAAPILEFARSNGTLDENVLESIQISQDKNVTLENSSYDGEAAISAAGLYGLYKLYKS